VWGVLLAATSAFAAETQVLPKGAWSFDVSYVKTNLDKQWDNDRNPIPLIPEMKRYEPGGGLQGTLTPRPVASFDVVMMQLMYGFTDRLSAGVYIPLVLQTVVDTHLDWTPGDFQPSLGRAYTADDFWAWAGSMGQPRPPDRWVGNKFTLSDMIIGGRYLLPETSWMQLNHLRWATTLQVALPTGKNFDPEEAVSAGTNLWELHAAGDVEVHLDVDKSFFVDEYGVPRVTIGTDLAACWFRPRLYVAGTGKINPLLNNIAPYVGDTYWVDPGDWLTARLSVDISPFLGPTRASIVSKHRIDEANKLPPMLTLNLSYRYVATGQSDWQSDSPLWDWDREKLWRPGDKNIFQAQVTLSLLRLGVPVQLYALARVQDIIPGRNTRPANVYSAGLRTLLKFW